MERKVIIGMLVSILAVVGVIFCAKRITGEDTPPTSQTDPPPSIATSATTTDFWDYLHGQTETTTTTAETDENGDPVMTTAATDENGNPITTEANAGASTEDTTTTTAPHLVFPG
ncbi:MAG: hypothetical protein PUC41_03770 [Oscillospiraceae bacterium]|nr:hypothetical protein [Oscillospiraceae bacterium]